FQQPLLANDFVVCNDQPGDMGTAQTGNEQVVFPFGNGVACKKGHPTRRKDGIPIIHGLFQTILLLDGSSDFIAVIFESISDGGPAVIFAGLDAVYLITATGPEFALPKIARNGMESQPLHIAVPIRVDFGTCIAPAFEWITGCGVAVWRNAEDLAQCGIQVLRQRPGFDIGTLAGADKDIARFIE